MFQSLRDPTGDGAGMGMSTGVCFRLKFPQFYFVVFTFGISTAWKLRHRWEIISFLNFYAIISCLGPRALLAPMSCPSKRLCVKVVLECFTCHWDSASVLGCGLEDGGDEDNLSSSQWKACCTPNPPTPLITVSSFLSQACVSDPLLGMNTFLESFICHSKIFPNNLLQWTSAATSHLCKDQTCLPANPTLKRSKIASPDFTSLSLKGGLPSMVHDPQGLLAISVPFLKQTSQPTETKLLRRSLPSLNVHDVTSVTTSPAS